MSVQRVHASEYQKFGMLAVLSVRMVIFCRLKNCAQYSMCNREGQS